MRKGEKNISDGRENTIDENWEVKGRPVSKTITFKGKTAIDFSCL